MSSQDLSPFIQTAAQKYNIDPQLLTALAMHESGGSPTAVNKAGGGQGAWGPMQVRQAALADYNAANGTQYKMQDLTKPDVGVDVGSWYLNRQMDKFGNPTQALIAYNEGAGSPNIAKGTTPYAQKVLSRIGTAQPSPQPETLPGIPVAKAHSASLDADALVNSYLPNANATNDKAADDLVNSYLPQAAPAKAATVQPTGQQPGILASVGAGIGRGVQEAALGAQQFAGNLAQKGQLSKAILSALPGGLGNAISSVMGAAPGEQALGQAAFQNANQGLRTGAADVAPYQKAHPIATGAGQIAGNIAATAPLAVTGPGGLAGLMGRGAITGAGMGAVTPVDPNSTNFEGNKAQQIASGVALGAVAPAALQGLANAGKYAGNVIGSLARPFSEGGRETIAKNVIAKAAAGGPTGVNAAEIVSGSNPTLAEATANPGIATLQRTMRDLNPNPFIAREQQNAAARSSVLGNIAGAPEDILAATAARDTAASQNYLSTHIGIPSSNTDYAALKQTPAFQSAFKKAQTMAQNAGVNSIETKVPTPGMSNMGGAKGPTETYVSGTGLHWVKQALDDQINSAAQAGEKSQAANLLGVKDKLLGMMDKEIPGYAEARGVYASASGPIDAMRYLQGLNLTNATGEMTLSKVQNALSALQKAQSKPGINLAKSVSQPQIDALTAVRDDLLRQSNTALGKSAGSATAQNLATQGIVQAALPGKLGALAGKLPSGTIGSTLGAVAGYGAAGPAGAAIGGSAGGFLGRGLSGLANTSNEAIQANITRMLLDPQLGGAALNSASRTLLPISSHVGLQRLLYPAAINSGVRALNPAGKQ